MRAARRSKPTHLALALIGLLSAVVAGCSPDAPKPAAAETLALRDFTLIDGTGKPPMTDAAMLVTDGRIEWVGPAAELRAPAGAETVSLRGKYVLPGLIDTHAHLGLTKDGLTVDAANQTRENVESQLKAYASYGVTGVLSMGTDQDVILQMRDAQRATGRPGEARIFSAGLGVVLEGGYGGLAGVTQKVSTPAEADAAVAREVARKVDIIKFWLDDELGTMPTFPAAMTQAIIDGAHRRGQRAAGHIFYLADARRIVDQGVDALSHSVRDKPVDDGMIAAMKAHGTWQQAATLAREQALFAYGAPAPWLDDPFFTQAVPAGTIPKLADPARQRTVAGTAHFAELPGFLKMAQANLKRLADAGIPYAMGTDAGGPGRFPGHAEHVELQLMVEAGLTPMQAIVAATGSGARFLKAADIGTIEKGKWADLLVLDADPLVDIRNSRAISAVYVAGRPVPAIRR